MIGRDYLSALRKIHARLSGTGIHWCITGSFALAIQGVPLQVHDIDIKSDGEGVYAIERLFADCVSKRTVLSSAGDIRSHFGELVIDGIRVEIIGAIQKRLQDGSWEEARDPERDTRVVSIDGMQIRVVTVEYEYEAYLERGKAEQAEIVRRWLEGDL